MSQLPYAAFDADNHYYEAEDAFTRHIDPKLARRAMRELRAAAEAKGRVDVSARVAAGTTLQRVAVDTEDFLMNRRSHLAAHALCQSPVGKMSCGDMRWPRARPA